MARASGLYSADILDRIKDALPPSKVVGRHKRLRKSGKEWVLAEDPSVTVVDQKGLIHDFGRSGFSGDIFDWEMDRSGCTFAEAVERLAREAGVRLPAKDAAKQGRKSYHAAGAKNGAGSQPDDERWGEDEGGPRPAQRGNGTLQHQGARQQQEPVAVYRYEDRDRGLLFEKLKYEGIVEGKRKKWFRKRREVPGESGAWIWGLTAGDYVRTAWGGRDLFQADKVKRGVVDHVRVEDEVVPPLYRLPDLWEEIQQDEDERRVIFVPEGEKDCDTLAAWGIMATCVEGGAKGFQPHDAEMFVGCDVVVIPDNDEVGRKAAHAKAMALRAVARRVRMLDWRKCAPTAGDADKFDVTKWAQKGGTKAEFFSIVEALREWSPEPPPSKYGGMRFVDIDKPGAELEWLVKRVITRGETSLWWGAPQCGKSFLLLDVALAVARGVSWFGCRVKRGLVIYQAGESGLGLKRRMRAYRQHHGIDHLDNLPFVLLPGQMSLHDSDADTDSLIEEAKAWSVYYDQPVAMIVVDTMAAATAGANENASEDMGRVMQRGRRIAAELRCHVAYAHHKPKDGSSPRGWSGLSGNIDTSIEVYPTEDRRTEVRADGTSIARVVRQFTTRKQKDDEDNLTWAFLLKQIVLGHDIDGEAITSCVIDPLSSPVVVRGGAVAPGYETLSPNNLALMRAMVKALQDKGVIPQAVTDGSVFPGYVDRVCRVTDWREALVQIRWPPGEDDPDGRKLRNTARKAVERTYVEHAWHLPVSEGGKNLIGKAGEYVWRTPVCVHQVDPPPTPATSPAGRREEESEPPEFDAIDF